MLNAVKLAMRITTTAFDAEIESLIAAACLDLSAAGIPVESTTTDALLRRAIITYCRLHFGTPDDYENLAASYWMQKANLQMAAGYGQGVTAL